MEVSWWLTWEPKWIIVRKMRKETRQFKHFFFSIKLECTSTWKINLLLKNVMEFDNLLFFVLSYFMWKWTLLSLHVGDGCPCSCCSTACFAACATESMAIFYSCHSLFMSYIVDGVGTPCCVQFQPWLKYFSSLEEQVLNS